MNDYLTPEQLELRLRETHGTGDEIAEAILRAYPIMAGAEKFLMAMTIQRLKTELLTSKKGTQNMTLEDTKRMIDVVRRNADAPPAVSKDMLFLLGLVNKAEEALKREQRALRVFLTFDQERGRPSGPEWIELMELARKALGDE